MNSVLWILRTFEDFLARMKERRLSVSSLTGTGSALLLLTGFLRLILSSYLDRSPVEVRFTYDKHGKPWLSDADRNGANVNFNLADSNTLAIYGITLQRAIGVDIEQIRTDFSGMT